MKIAREVIMDQKSEKELGTMVPEIIALVGGIISMIIFVIPMEYTLEPFLGSLVAPIVEEPLKVIGLVFLALYYPYTLETKKNGLILGGLAGLGFAFLENFLYLIRAEMGSFDIGPGSVAITRSIFPLSVHVLNSALVGYALLFLAKKKIGKNSSNVSSAIQQMISEKNIWSILVIAMALHFQYNLLSGIGAIGAIIGIAIVFFVFYKLYHYFPEKIDELTITSPIQLFSDATKYNKKKLLSENGTYFNKQSERPSLFCAKCGANISSKDSFCQECGNSTKRKGD